MQKIYLSLIVTVFEINISYAQWTTGTDINNTNTGKVGIGTAGPVEKLSTDGDYLIQNSSANSKGYLF
jgi:hypothetical protein